MNLPDLTKINIYNTDKPGIETGLAHDAGNLRAKVTGFIKFLFSEPRELRLYINRVNWWLAGLLIGLLLAVFHLILVFNPSVCYLYAKDHINGFETTLPEAMASVKAWAWFGMLSTPPVLVFMLAAVAWLMKRISPVTRHKGDFRVYLGILTTAAGIIALGQFTGYIMVGALSLKSITDIRDLTPGVGLGLLSFFTAERIGLFWREVIRGFDLFGIWVVWLSAAMFRVYYDFTKLKSLMLAGVYYGIFIVLRWVVEGPGYVLWRFFWNAGSV